MKRITQVFFSACLLTTAFAQGNSALKALSVARLAPRSIAREYGLSMLGRTPTITTTRSLEKNLDSCKRGIETLQTMPVTRQAAQKSQLIAQELFSFSNKLPRLEAKLESLRMTLDCRLKALIKQDGVRAQKLQELIQKIDFQLQEIGMLRATVGKTKVALESAAYKAAEYGRSSLLTRVEFLEKQFTLLSERKNALEKSMEAWNASQKTVQTTQSTARAWGQVGLLTALGAVAWSDTLYDTVKGAFSRIGNGLQGTTTQSTNEVAEQIPGDTQNDMQETLVNGTPAANVTFGQRLQSLLKETTKNLSQKRQLPTCRRI